MPSDITNTEALGRILYTKYVYFFQAAGMVLLVAMIGAIVLTLRHRENVKRQSVPAQVARDASGMSVIKVGSGEAQVPAKASKVKEAAE
jgi:NADH-quinone oxidoreductase subunit J